MAKAKLPKPQKCKKEMLEEISNETKKGYNYAVVIAMADGKTRTEKEIAERVVTVVITAALELNRRAGLIEVSKNFGWFKKWEAKLRKMKCPRCNAVWPPIKGSRCCPMCGLDLMALVEAWFPSLKKLKKRSKK